MKLTGLTRLIIGSALTGSLVGCNMKEDYRETTPIISEEKSDKTKTNSKKQEISEEQFSPPKQIMDLLHNAYNNPFLKMPCSTKFMTGEKERIFASWFDLIEYFKTASSPKKDEFETESEYQNRLQKVNKIDKDFTIYFIPTLDTYSHEEQGFAFSISFFLTKTKHHPTEYWRDDNDFLTEYNYFIKVDDLEKARWIRENNREIIGTLEGKLDCINQDYEGKGRKYQGLEIKKLELEIKGTNYKIIP